MNQRGFMLQNLSFPAPEKDCFRKWQWAPIPPCLFIMESELHTKRFVHPRFGPIKCIRTLRAVEADEELTVAYGYDHSPPGKSGPEAPEWYQVELKAFQATQQK
ncbi:histone-lysine N-methyltransferase SETD7 isoform X2 [Oryctolagus cuniculus]|uniref:histone-lysine N-methyltransferase SETD7 isoform X2 n=1 Tax=Oryctolagus cuniculus TaxID=9986 RepID=UPI003879055A